MSSSHETAPLLSTPKRQVFDSREARYATQPPPIHSWHGELCDLCGPSCSDWGSCAFSYFLPCLAFGSNMKRAFRSSWWLHALVYFILFFGFQWASGVTSGYAGEVCKADLPAPQQPARIPSGPDATAHDTWLSGRKLLQVDDGPGKFSEAFADVLPSATAKAVVHGGSVDASSDEAHAQSLPAGPKDPKVKHVTTAEVNAHRPPNPVPEFPRTFYLPLTPEYAGASPGCQNAYLLVSTLNYIGLVAAFAGTIYAARLRTLMRKRFSIPGSSLCDLLTWMFCLPCAMCQETRTLRANNVFDGEWDNPRPQPGQIVAAADWTNKAVTKPPKVVEV